jgi:hypothetical protein
MTKSKPTKRQLTLRKLEALAESTTHAPEAEVARAKVEQMKVRTVHVQVAPATERDAGEVAIGHYFVEGGDTVVVTDAGGVPLRHREVPCRVVLLPDQTAEQVAKRLTREMHASGNPSGDFYRKLRYPNRSPV